MIKNKFSPIEKIISISKKGGMYILVDDENRENEGDLVFNASDVNSKKINFMAKNGRGLICLTLNKNQANKLGLTFMAPVNQSRNQTAFTISIEAKKGITTGISAKDRSRTIKVATKKNVLKNEIVSPGHVFPIISREGGVLVRAGHTEASVDIARLGNKIPAAVICEIMNEDGSMAKGDDLLKFASKHKLHIAKIEDLISYRLRKENLIKLKKEIQKLNWVHSVITLLDIPLLNSSDEPLIERLQNYSTLSTDGIDKERGFNEILNSPVFRNFVISEDGKTSGIIVYLKSKDKIKDFKSKKDEEIYKDQLKKQNQS